jgi:hypothetical protein
VRRSLRMGTFVCSFSSGGVRDGACLEMMEPAILHLPELPGLPSCWG